jgi:hypothetical protein
MKTGRALATNEKTLTRSHLVYDISFIFKGVLCRFSHGAYAALFEICRWCRSDIGESVTSLGFWPAAEADAALF